MKEQFEKGREDLIGNLEQRLAQLKQKRDKYLTKQSEVKEMQVDNVKVNIGEYLNQFKNNQQKKSISSDIICIQKERRQMQQPVQTKSKAEIIRQKQQTKRRCQQLQQIFNKKRQLQRIGIYQNDPNKVMTIFAGEEGRKKLNKELSKRKKEEQIKMERQKIVKEELGRVQNFLKEGKKEAKTRKQINQYHYSVLLGKQQAKLKQYSGLLLKNRLTLLQQERLVQLTFNFLKDFDNKASKQKVKQFLLANQQFSTKFNITKTEIMRDLLVHQTQQPGYLTFSELYQLIKSIQITNQALQPNLKYNHKSVKRNGNSQLQKDVQKQSVVEDKEMVQYLKKLFKYLDSRNERIVERDRLQIALKKGLLFDGKKYKISKDKISQFGNWIIKTKEKVKPLEYYKELDLKYIGWEELIDQYKKSAKQYSTSKNTPQPESDNKIANQINESQNASQIPNSQFQIITQPKEQELDDFQKYGWPKQHSYEQFNQLKKVDAYYKDIANKHGNQIHWNGINHYQQDFNKFNLCIQLISKDKNNRVNDLNYQIMEVNQEQELH